MTTAPRVFSIAAGTPFLPALVNALCDGTLAPGIDFAADPLAWSGVTIYLPTRRAARTLRSLLAEADGGRPTILPTVKALGEFDEEEAAFDASSETLSLLPPVASLDRLLMLAPLVEAWKRKLPGEIRKLYDEQVVVPVSAADTIWLARDLARLMDDIETEGSDWNKLATLAPEDFANWWQVTLDFLRIATETWPAKLAGRGASDPAVYRNTAIRLEAARLQRLQPKGPVIAAGSTGSIPATAELLSVIARLPAGAVVLPGLDANMSERSWQALGKNDKTPAVVGHPQFGLRRLLEKLGVAREGVEPLGKVQTALATRGRIVSDALRPAETTDEWLKLRSTYVKADVTAALTEMTLIDAANEREEALAIAVALRFAIADPGRTSALVTADRDLARRVAAELLRFGIVADDSGGVPLRNSSAAVLLRTLLRAVFEAGDPVQILSLIKHPLLRLRLPRGAARSASEVIELVALRGGAGRPVLRDLGRHFEERYRVLKEDSRGASWFRRVGKDRWMLARDVLQRLDRAVAPLSALAERTSVSLIEIAQASIAALETLARDENGALADLYAGNAGEELAAFLRDVLATREPYDLAPAEWPNILDALIDPSTVKPRVVDDNRIAIWGTLEARLQSVDTLVLGGLNEGNWPRKARGDRFLSRLMRSGLDLQPPEREIGLAAHDFEMAMGGRKLVLSRAARAGDAPAVPSRWLQRFTTFIGSRQTEALTKRGAELIELANRLDHGKDQSIPRAEYAPPVVVRPDNFSVTEIETLRRDPYAIYAKRILDLHAIQPLIRDPGAADRGNLIHLILHRFATSGVKPSAPEAVRELLNIGRQAFAEAALPQDVHEVWWPRFERTASQFIRWEREREEQVDQSFAELRAVRTEVDATGVTLRAFADRIDVLLDGRADVIDYKTGSSPSKRQAHVLLSPQLALEGALLKRGAFEAIGERDVNDLLLVRLKANGMVFPDSILEHNRKTVLAEDLAQRAWGRLEELLTHFANPDTPYRSRMLPFRESDMDGDYDHLARVLEWSAGAEDEDETVGGSE